MRVLIVFLNHIRKQFESSTQHIHMTRMFFLQLVRGLTFIPTYFFSSAVRTFQQSPQLHHWRQCLLASSSRRRLCRICVTHSSMTGLVFLFSNLFKAWRSFPVHLQLLLIVPSDLFNSAIAPFFEGHHHSTIDIIARIVEGHHHFAKADTSYNRLIVVFFLFFFFSSKLRISTRKFGIEPFSKAFFEGLFRARSVEQKIVCGQKAKKVEMCWI